MPRLRRLGNALSDTGGMLLQHLLRLQEQQQQADLVRQRQQELAEYNNDFRRRQAEDAQEAEEYKGVLSDPTGMRARTLVDAGKAQYSRLLPSNEAVANRFAVGLNDVSDRAKLPTDLGIESALRASAQPSAGMDPRYVQQGILARNSRRGAIDEAAMATSADKQRDASATAYGTASGTERAAQENFPSALGRKSAEFATMTPLEVDRAGKEAGARAKATLPYDAQLAQVRANVQLQRQQEMEEWKQDHPTATTQERNKASNAIAALGVSQEIRAMVQELDKRGVLGPLAGRAAEIAAGTVKAEDLFPDKATAKLVADYFSSVKLLSSLAAVTHGGARGGGSIQMVKQFEKVLSGTGDRSIIEGQLDALDRLMTHYKEHPRQPAAYGVDGTPGIEPNMQAPMVPGAAPGGPPAGAPTTAQQKLDLLRKR